MSTIVHALRKSSPSKLKITAIRICIQAHPYQQVISARYKAFLSRITGQVIDTEAKQQGPQEASPALLDGVLADASGAVPKALAI